MNEAERQQRLLASLLAAKADVSALDTRGGSARALRGLQAYRANADASATRALATAFATVQSLIGDDDFAQLAREYWRAEPPQRGDLGEWGAGFASWLESHTAFAEWPYLGDCARLDWALHQCERAADTVLDADSIARLGDTDPARLRLQLADGVALIESRWPIAMILDAHRRGDDAAFITVRKALAEGHPEAVLVFRQDWKGVAQAIDAPTAEWTRQLLLGADLAMALAQVDAGFDFAAWLTVALQAAWLKGIAVAPD
jgi:hypothetical protein